MKIAARTHVGMVREKNEDSYYIDEKERKLFVVADGMGGHQAGEIASNMTVETIAVLFREKLNGQGSLDNAKETIDGIIDKANEVVYRKSFEDDKFSGMGTTLVMAVYQDDKIYIGHVGDSRAYLLKDNDMKQITKDHTLVQALVDNGTITSEEAKMHPKRNVLTRALGTNRAIDIDVYTVDEFENESILILCTDGLTGAVSDEEINRIFKSSGVDNGCDSLIELANERGGYDNITIVAIEFTNESSGGND